MSLYKDQVEMDVILTKNISKDYCYEILEQAKKYNDALCFFKYLLITSIVLLVYKIFQLKT